MKKMYLVLFVITMFSSLVACQKESLNEIDQINQNSEDVFNVDRTKIRRPGTQHEY